MDDLLYKRNDSDDIVDLKSDESWPHRLETRTECRPLNEGDSYNC